MAAISEFVFATFVASLLAVWAERITPEAMTRYVRLIASLIVLLYIITPLKNLCLGFVETLEDTLFVDDEKESSSTESYEALLSMSEAAAEKSLRLHLAEEFDITSGIDLSLSMTIENETTVLISSVKIGLSEEYGDLAPNIQEYVEALFCCQVEVLIEGG